MLKILLNKAEFRTNNHPLHTRELNKCSVTGQMHCMNSTQHLEKQRKCRVPQHLFSESLITIRLTEQDSTRVNKAQQGGQML